MTISVTDVADPAAGDAVGTCLACGGCDLEHVVDLGSGPAFVGASWDDPDQARRAPRGRLDLWLCRSCGHVANRDFDAALLDYDGDYDNSLHHSPIFQGYATELARRLVDTYDLRGRRVVEIGSGKGEFLVELCTLGGGTGVGYDPTCRAGTPAPGVTLVSDYYRPGEDLERYALLVCRHVLEHLDDPAAVLRSIRDGAADDAVLYLEVPAAEFNFGPDGLWDCIYPHVSYFCESSLRALLARCGFDVIDGGRSFSGQFLWVEVRPGTVVADVVGPAGHLEVVRGFARAWSAAVSTWREQLADRGRRGERVVLWGAGSKGVVFLNAIDDGKTLTVVDVNPRKQGAFLPGTGHLVETPEALAGRDVSSVLVTNPVYVAEIRQQLHRLGVDAEVVTV